jgi:hypothetical protein
MGLDWHFVRMTPEQYTRLLTHPTFETVEAIHNERSLEGLGDYYSLDEEDPDAISFDTVYHLGLRTDYDELDTLMTFEDDDGPKVLWPLGESGFQLSALSDITHLLSPEEVRSLAPTLQLLLEGYLDRRFQAEIKELAQESPEDVLELEELYPELRACFSDLTRFVSTAAEYGEAVLWDLS